MSSLHGYTVNRASFFSAKTILENFFWPSDHLALPDHPVLDNCGVIDAVPMEDDISSYNVTFAIVGELGIFLEEVGVEVVFFSGNTGFSTFEFRLDTADQVKVHLNTAFEIRFHPKILFPVEAGDLDISSNWSRISFESQISIDINGAFSFEPMGVTNLTKSFIGETGIAIEATGVEIAIWNNPSFVGLKRVSVTLPTEIQGAPEVVIEDAFIDSRGFSGNVSTEWALVLTPDGKDFDSGSKVGTLFSEDIKFAFRQIQLSLENNIPTGFRIIGALKLPSFDNVVEAELSLTESGEILVAMRGIGGDLITFSKENLFILDVKAFEIFRSDQELALTLNCDLKLTHPTVKDLIPKLGLEKFTVHKLDGKKWSFRVEGGTVEIQKSVDLFGVARCDINEIGISERGGQDHLTFSGGVQLLEGVDAGAWVEGLRVPLGSGGGLALDGIGLRVVVPKSFEFEGSAVRKQENGISYFEGLMNLKLLPIQMGMGAYLKVGKNSNCRFAYLAAKLELPEPGIPLASLPLYLRSIEGLIGINSTPDAEKIQDYFSLSNREPIGLTHGSKWRDQCGSHAIGFGVGIATANSRLLHISSLLAFLYPELVLLIEGKAFVLQKPNPKKTPPFHALLAFDSDEPSALINISVQQEFIQGVMEASGMVEAYFSPDTWHLALGQAKPYFPVDRPIGAKVLKLFSANSYLILTPKTWELGSSIGLKEKYGFKRASVHFKASMKGVGQLNWGPEQVKGYLDLQGSVGFRIWKIGFDLSLRASVLGMAPDWLVEAILEFFIKIRLVFKKRKFGGKIPFRWERRVTPPLSPVLKEIVLQHRVSEKSWRPYLLHSFESHSCATVPPLASIPVVEPDTLPTLTFHYPINDRTGNTFGQEIRETELRHQSGDYEFVAELPEEENGHRGIELFRLPINQWGTDNWERFRATTNDVNSNGEIGEPSPILYGAWQADKAPDGTEGATHLHLFAQTPFEYNQPVRLSVIHRGSYLNKVGSLDSCDPIRVDEPSVLNNDSASTIEIPSFNWELKDPDDLRKTARAFPSRPVQYVFKEDHQYPWNAVVEKKEECINFLTTRSGWYHGNELVQVGAESIPVPDFGVHQQPSEDVLLWGFSLYYPPHVPVEEVEEGRLPIPHGICNVTTDQSFPSLKYLSFPYHKIYGSDGSVYNLTPNNRPKFREGVPGLFLCMILLKNLVERLTINYSGRFISFLQPSDEIPFQNFPAIQFASAFQADFPGQNVWPTNKDITIQPSPTVDNSEDGKLVISALSSAQAFNKVLVSIIAPAKIYSLCYVVDSYNKIKEKENQLDNYACTIWPKTPGTNIPSGPMSKNAPAMETQTDELGLGYVYRLEVTTKQARKNRHGATRNDSYCAFFQVSRPPSSLASYVLTSYPKATGFPHYRTHEIFIRFHKSYIHNLLGKQDHEFSWKLLLRGRTLSILPFRDGEDADLERFQENLDPARNGWGWGKSTTHKLTDEEKVWMAAFNRQSSVHISESWANPDDMIWIYPINPILMRSDFRASVLPQTKVSLFQPPQSESGTVVTDRWKIRASQLYHEAQTSLSFKDETDSFLLTEPSFSLPFQISVWLKPQSNLGSVGVVLSQENTLDSYVLLSIDVETQKITLKRKNSESDPSNRIWPSKDFGITENQWVKITLNATGSSGNFVFTLNTSGQSPFHVVTDWLIKDPNQKMNSGLYATSDYVGTFDNFEVLSLRRLQNIPQPNNTHHLSFFYEIHPGFSSGGENSGLPNTGVEPGNLTVQREPRFEEVVTTSVGVPRVDRFYAHEKEPIEIYRTEFLSSRYLDLYDHLNSWGRNIRQSQGDGENDHRVLVESLRQWTNSSCSLLLALGEVISLEEEKSLGNASLDDLSKAKESLREARFDLDIAFDETIGLFGFDRAPRIHNFEITLAQNRLGLLIETPEPIDWTRISSALMKSIPETRVGNPLKPKTAHFLYSSDFTRGILLLRKKKMTLESFAPNEIYEWVIKQNFSLPPHLKWLTGWVTHRREEHRLTLEIP